jgi:hypothetical protein
MLVAKLAGQFAQVLRLPNHKNSHIDMVAGELNPDFLQQSAVRKLHFSLRLCDFA